MPGGKIRCALLVATIAVLTTAAPATPAAAAPAHCTGTPAAAGRPIAQVPWTQQRYAPERLSPLANGAGITVAVIDSGVDASHPQLAGAVLAGTDLLDEGTGRFDCLAHGTAVASIIAARPAAGVGFAGLAPGAMILPIRVSEQLVIEGEANGRPGTAAGLAAAIRYAVQHDAQVLNLSIILNRDNPAVRAAVRFALDNDVVVVAAVGNEHGQGDPTPYPAAYDGVLGVGALGPDGARMPGSQVGSYVDLVAPGMEITAAARVRGHDVYQGTSFATPFVAATAALVRQYRPELSGSAVVRRIIATVDPAPGGPSSTEYGHGVLNPYRAVSELLASGGTPDRAAPLPAAVRDATAEAAVRRDAARARLAVTLAAGAGVLAAAVLFGALALPRGARRRWRPGASGRPETW